MLDPPLQNFICSNQPLAFNFIFDLIAANNVQVLKVTTHDFGLAFVCLKKEHRVQEEAAKK